jgi:hypothetical protein
VNGDKTMANRGDWDYWVVKTDSLGNKMWDKCFGGLQDDFATAVENGPNGGFLIGGYSKSTIGGDKSQPSQGNWDYWVVRTDDQGAILWERTFGGNFTDWLFDMTATSDGGFLLGGQSFSQAAGDKSEPNHDPTPAGSDRWIVKIDDNGNKIWDRTYGADQIEDLTRIVETDDGGFLISGESYSAANGDKTENNLGIEQTWVLKTDAVGNLLWDKTIFTLGHDELGVALPVDSLCFVAVNYTLADTGGYKTQPTQGAGDYWMVKICIEDPLFVPGLAHSQESYSIFPNPSEGTFFIQSGYRKNEKVHVEISDVRGQVIRFFDETIAMGKSIPIDVTSLPNGIYFCKIQSRENKTVMKIVINK